jgi:hypothetical protein
MHWRLAGAPAKPRAPPADVHQEIPPMPYDPNEVFAGNSSINAAIHEMLVCFPEPSRSRMRTKIRQDARALRKQGTDQADEAARHTFREFVVAHRLNENGFRLEYNKKVERQTPDWFDEQSKLLLEVFTCERSGKCPAGQRIATTIATKATKYRELVHDKNLCYVVAVYCDFFICYFADDFADTIRENTIFETYPHVSGLVFFTDGDVYRVVQPDGSIGLKQDYRFTYFGNPTALMKIELATKLAARANPA